MTTVHGPTPASAKGALRALVRSAVAALSVGLIIASTLSVVDVVRTRSVTEFVYATVADAPHRGSEGAELPAWVPADAVDIHLLTDTRGRGTVVELGTTSTATGAGCTSTPAPGADPVPTIDLPDEVRRAAGQRCGDWFVFVRDGRMYGWEAFRSPAGPDRASPARGHGRPEGLVGNRARLAALLELRTQRQG